MLNFITNKEMRNVDAFTCETLNLTSLELMEQAAQAFVASFVSYCTKNRHVTIFAGKGNNGGDGLAIARLLYLRGYHNIEIYILDLFNTTSKDFIINYERLKELKIEIKECSTVDQLPLEFDVVIDAVLGTGFNKSLGESFKKIFTHLNSSSSYIISVDVPSGCDTDKFSITEYFGIHAHLTISFQRTKLFFTLPESKIVTNDFMFVSIGLSEKYLQDIPSDFFYIDFNSVTELLPKRENFSHKGNFGHVLVYSGNSNTRGAALLTAKAALYSGAGLVTLAVESDFVAFVNMCQPEIMSIDKHSVNSVDWPKYNACVIGPGLGTDFENKKEVLNFIKQSKFLVLDADALNVLTITDFSQLANKNIIITPHMKEFDRLFGTHESWYERLLTAKKYAEKLGIIIVLKNQYTFICNQDGKVYVNSTGNPAMSQGGMGDALSGCITAFLARGLQPLEAAILGCYSHGFSGDLLAKDNEIVTASLLINNLPKTLRLINDKNLI